MLPWNIIFCISSIVNFNYEWKVESYDSFLDAMTAKLLMIKPNQFGGGILMETDMFGERGLERAIVRGKGLYELVSALFSVNVSLMQKSLRFHITEGPLMKETTSGAGMIRNDQKMAGLEIEPETPLHYYSHMQI